MGNPLIKEKMDLDVAVTRLKVSKANHVSQQYTLEDSIRKTFPESIARTEQRIAGFEKDLAHLKSLPEVKEGIAPMTVMGKTFTEKEDAGKAILMACKKIYSAESVDIGEYKGFDMYLSYDSFMNEFHLNLQRDMTYSVVLGTSETGNIVRIDNALDSVEKKLQDSVNQLESLYTQMETAKEELGKPFPQEQELAEKLERLNELNAILNIDGNEISADREGDDILDDEGESEKKPSILGKIKDIKAEQGEKKSPDAPSKNRNEELE